MNQEIYLGPLRIIVGGICAWLATKYGLKGLDDPASIAALTSIVVGLGMLVWSIMAHTQGAQLSRVEAMPGIKVVVDTKNTAAPDAAVVAAVDPAHTKVLMLSDPQLLTKLTDRSPREP
jgi:hypothetical protein